MCGLRRYAGACRHRRARGGPPVTSIRNTSSPHWRRWLKPETSCLVPASSFVECQSDAGDPDDG